MVDISIIIPLYKGKKYLKQIKEMLKENILLFDAEFSVQVIFINDYPDEKITDKECMINGFDCILVSNKENLGIHGARIVGVQVATGEYIIMLDQDDLVQPTWLLSQWNYIQNHLCDVCVCNGWKRRFAVLWNYPHMQERINNLNYYLEVGCQIVSPGQVIIKREELPQEWFTNVVETNGADDYFLWLLLLKKGVKFELNDEYLFYHTPERTLDSISVAKMQSSLIEVLEKLRKIGIFSERELHLLEDKIRRNTSIAADKAWNMFNIMYNWRKLTNQGLSISAYLKNQGYKKIAIYGLGYIGESLYEEMEMNQVNVVYGIDATAKDFKGELPIYHVDAPLPECDLVIVTISTDVENGVIGIKSKLGCNVFSMSELITRTFNEKMDCK